MASTSLRLPDHLTRELDEIATKRRTTRSDLIREAVERYCSAARDAGGTDLVELIEQLVTYPGSGVGDLGRRSEVHLREMFRDRRRRSR